LPLATHLLRFSSGSNMQVRHAIRGKEGCIRDVRCRDVGWGGGQ